jgi:hypothetical protein
MTAKNKNPFDRFLLNYFILEDNRITLGFSENEAEVIFNKQYEAKLSSYKIELMLDALKNELSKDTLGTLIAKSIQEKQIKELELLQKTGLTPSLIEAVKTDMIFTNSIPVKSLVKLVKALSLSINSVKEAINTTFDKLSVENKLFLSTPQNVQPSFRRGITHQDIAFDYKNLKSDESYLYQNKEALDMYTSRLTELYNEI